MVEEAENQNQSHFGKTSLRGSFLHQDQKMLHLAPFNFLVDLCRGPGFCQRVLDCFWRLLLAVFRHEVLGDLDLSGRMACLSASVTLVTEEV